MKSAKRKKRNWEIVIEDIPSKPVDSEEADVGEVTEIAPEQHVLEKAVLDLPKITEAGPDELESTEVASDEPELMDTDFDEPETTEVASDEPELTDALTAYRVEEVEEQPESSKPAVKGKARLWAGGVFLLLAGLSFLAISLSTCYIALAPVFYGMVSIAEFSWSSIDWWALLPILTLTTLTLLCGILAIIRAGRKIFSITLVIFVSLALALGLAVNALWLLDFVLEIPAFSGISIPLWSVVVVLQTDPLLITAFVAIALLLLILGSALALSGNLAKRGPRKPKAKQADPEESESDEPDSADEPASDSSTPQEAPEEDSDSETDTDDQPM